MERIEALEEMQNRLATKGLITFEVPSEGNCALYSLHCLMTLKSNIASAETVAHLRNEIATVWEENKSVARWQYVFDNMMLVQEETPKKKKKKAKKAKVEPKLSTPPKKLPPGRWEMVGVIYLYKYI